ncbi:MAG: glycosyltransferase family 2 protein [Dehalococcoidia bacterium]
MKPDIAVIVPAMNEADAIARVIADIPPGIVEEIIVVNNNSSDATPDIARSAGATVLDEPRQGYGFACMRGVNYLAALRNKPDIVVFLDSDYSDYPSEMTDLIKPIVEQDYDMVIGCRSFNKNGGGAMPLQQIWGNWLAKLLIKLFYGVKFGDLGPFRAIKFNSLMALDVKDQTYGWPVEMQLKALKRGLRVYEVPVSYRPRIGKSKISGTVKGTLLAGYKILSTIIKYR